jgi:hypothetical protein
MVRVIIRPPGHTLRGPATTPSTSDWAIVPPFAMTRAQSSGESSTRWLLETWTISDPVSRKAVLSPTLQWRDEEGMIDQVIIRVACRRGRKDQVAASAVRTWR